MLETHFAQFYFVILLFIWNAWDNESRCYQTSICCAIQVSLLYDMATKMKEQQSNWTS